MAKTLEQEFREIKEQHMYEMSVSALIACADEGVYEHELLQDYIDLDMPKKEKAYYVIDDIYAKGDKEFQEVYEVLWEKVRDHIRDDVAYRLNVNYN